MTTTAENVAETALEDGRVVVISGPVVDVEFPPRVRCPEINFAVALEVELVGQGRALDHHRGGRPAARRGTRAVHLRTEADRRPAPGAQGVATTGHGITVPVGDAVLGSCVQRRRRTP